MRTRVTQFANQQWRLADMREKAGLNDDEARGGVIDRLVAEIIEAYTKNPDVKSLT